MTEKRFKIIDEQFISYYGGTGHKISNGECGFWLWHSKEESQKVCDKLNSILDEKEQLKIDLGIAEDNHKLDKEIIDDLQKYIKKLEKENKKLKELVIEVDNNLEIRDIVCGAGKFRLEEWGKHRYHQFYKGDEELEDESIVIMLMELEKENKELKAKVDDKEVAVEVECEKLMQKLLDLIDEKIKLYSHKPVSAPISQPMSVNFDADVDRLARLSELEALKEELTE